MSLLLTMCVYSISMSVSPGPVNLITFSSGVNFGVRKTLPFVTGATSGFILLLFLVGIGFQQLLEAQSPMVKQAMVWLACLFIAYLGYTIVMTDTQVDTGQNDAPGFFSGFVFQWLNPKAWLASVAGISAFELSDSLEWLLIFIGIYFVCCYVCVCLWAVAGHKLSSVIREKGYLKVLNQCTGAVLIVIACYLLLENVLG